MDSIAAPGTPLWRKHLPILRQPAIRFGMALIAVVWLAALHLTDREADQDLHDLTQEVANLALVFEQNVVRTASELDRILKFIRRSYERSGYRANWPSLIQEEYTIKNETVQIAIIARDGMMITSTAMLYPKQPVNLSDREHYRVHAQRLTDELFISKPMIGRASGKWSVQFTRPFFDEGGAFSGVLVVSLDPAHLTRAYADLKLGAGYGLALLGSDGLVRAGAGVFAETLGKSPPDFTPAWAPESGTSIRRQDIGGKPAVIASRPVQGYPLQVVVAAHEPEIAFWERKQTVYFLGAGILTTLTLAAMAASAINRYRHESRIMHLARCDSLTGLANRRHLEETLLRVDAAGRKVALHLVDLDGFKNVNDTHGHPIGDKLLIEVGKRLAANVRSGDLLARVGGDEFAIVQMLDGTAAGTAELGARICKVISEPFEIAGLYLAIGASVGTTHNLEARLEPAGFLKRADLALYAAKADGRGRARSYQKSMGEAARERDGITTGLREAIEQNRFVLHFQPIVELETGQITSYEALLRWTDPKRGNVPPGSFIPVAEESGLIVPIGEWVLHQACAVFARTSGKTSVAVNCSPIQLQDGNFVEAVRTALRESGLAPSRLKLEITESTLMDGGGVALEQLRELDRCGIHIALDDFGTGYSCLAYLQQYPVKCIKIDRLFVSSMEKTISAKLIVRTIIGFARALGLRTIAEGVETQSQLDMLRQLGCDEAQGYYLGRPGPADQVIATESPGAEAAEAAGLTSSRAAA